MRKKRRNFSAEFKTNVAFEAIRERKTIHQLSEEYELHPTQISEWKKQMLSEGIKVFESTESVDSSEHEKLIDDLKREIGTLYIELEWLKKKLPKI